MRAIQGVGDVGGELHGLVHATPRFAIERGTQRLAVDERHGVPQTSVSDPGIEERHDVRVLQRGRGLDLLHDALGAQHGGESDLRWRHGRDDRGAQDVEGEPGRKLHVKRGYTSSVSELDCVLGTSKTARSADLWKRRGSQPGASFARSAATRAFTARTTSTWAGSGCVQSSRNASSLLGDARSADAIRRCAIASSCCSLAMAR